MKIKPDSQQIKQGTIFGEWTVIGNCFPQTRKTDGATDWWIPCQCSCGVYRAVKIPQLKNGHSKSCGWCVGVTSQYRRLYTIWRGMLARCTNENSQHYLDYGGRGIFICLDWRENFKSFRDWAMLNGYGEGLVLDRKNNDGNYEPDNCQWSTHKENNRNKRDTRLVSAFGEIKSLMSWSEDSRCSISYSGLRGRLDKGISPEVAITTPKSSRKKHAVTLDAT